jgi:hypothetical protein
MKALTPVALAALLAASTPTLAVDRTFETQVEAALKPSVPADWFLRASWRDATLVVFVSPPVPESFKIWYDSGRQKTMMEDICKAIPQTIWSQINPEQDIAIEQVVGGNGGKGSWRLSCRDDLADSASKSN